MGLEMDRMTAKRFWYDFEDPYGAKMVDFVDDKKYSLETIGDFREIENLLNTLSEENEQLKERNERQAKQLDNLYTLIEKQDWKTLKGLIQEFQECEEQLQKEWRTYE